MQYDLHDLSRLHGPLPGCFTLFFSPAGQCKNDHPLLCKMLGTPAGRKKPVLSEWSEEESEK